VTKRIEGRVRNPYVQSSRFETRPAPSLEAGFGLREASDASRSGMHRAATQKSHIPYSCLAVAEVLQARLQNAQRIETRRAMRRNPYSTVLFRLSPTPDDRGGGGPVSARSSMPAPQR
jgi:hypothetical protein